MDAPEGLEDCQTIKGPILEIELQGFNMTLHPEDYMRKLPLLEGLQVGSEKGVTLEQQPEDKPPVTKVNYQPQSEPDPNGKKHCRPRLMPVNLPEPLGPNLFILGEPVLHRYYTVYDWTQKQVGFGLAANDRNRAHGRAASDEDEEPIYSFMQVTMTVTVRVARGAVRE